MAFPKTYSSLTTHISPDTSGNTKISVELSHNILPFSLVLYVYACGTHNLFIVSSIGSGIGLSTLMKDNVNYCTD